MLNIAFHSFPDFSSNARALYEYMSSKYKNKMHFVWIIENQELAEKLKKQGIDVLQKDSSLMEERLKTIDVFFTTHASLTDYKKQNSNTLYVELWHGVSPKNVGFLINNINKNDYDWLNKIKKKIDYFIVPSEFWVPIFSARFNVLPTKILPLGFPMIDNILKSNGKKNLSKVLGCDLSKYKKIIYYMPTARIAFGREKNVLVNTSNSLNLEKYDEKELIDYLEENKYLLCIKYHPSEKMILPKTSNSYIKYIDQERMEKYNLDTNMILNAADLMISDYSSVGLLFLMLNKPVIYLTNDLKDFSVSRGILFDNFDFWTVGDDVKTLKEFIQLLTVRLKENDKAFSSQRKLLFGTLRDGGCANIVNYFFDENGNLKDNLVYTYDENLEVLEENKRLKEELKIIKSIKENKRLKWLRRRK